MAIHPQDPLGAITKQTYVSDSKEAEGPGQGVGQRTTGLTRPFKLSLNKSDTQSFLRDNVTAQPAIRSRSWSLRIKSGQFLISVWAMALPRLSLLSLRWGRKKAGGER